MIHVFGRTLPPVPRLIEALASRGHRVSGGPPTAGESATLVLGPGPEIDVAALEILIGAWRRAPGARVLVLSQVGAHPDAHATRLRRLWEIEERARGFELPTLTLRLAPLIGPSSPLWLRLRSRPRLPRGGRQLLNPVLETDVIETLERALDGRARWTGWYEVAGEQTLSLAELVDLAAASGPGPSRGAWEPSLEEMAEQRLSESGPWSEHFGFRPHPVADEVRQWAA